MPLRDFPGVVFLVPWLDLRVQAANIGNVSKTNRDRNSFVIATNGEKLETFQINFKLILRSEAA
jgi:hypothetical protein